MVSFNSNKILLICLILLLLIIPATILFVSGMKFAVPKTLPLLSTLPGNDSILTIQPSPIKTVFVVVMENQDWSNIINSSSSAYIKQSLLPNASYATQYYSPKGLHPSEGNYLWMEAGTNFGVKDDNSPADNHQSTTSHLTTLLSNSGIPWKSYQEGIDGNQCPLQDNGLYSPRHNPMVYFDDVTDNNNPDSLTCNLHIRPIEELFSGLKDNSVTGYNFITPNLCDDMHDSAECDTQDPIKNGDTWLSKTIPRITNSSAYKNGGAIFITWDEGTAPNGVENDGPIGMIVMSPLAKGHGYYNSIHYTHSSLLLTLQEIFNVKPLLGDAVNATDLGDLFISASETLAPQKVAAKTPTPTTKLIAHAVTGTPTVVPTKKPTVSPTPSKGPANMPTPTSIKRFISNTWQIYQSGQQIADTAFSFIYSSNWQIIYQDISTNTYNFLIYPAVSLQTGQNILTAPVNIEHETMSVKVYQPAKDMPTFIMANFPQYKNILQYSDFGPVGNKTMYELTLPSSNPNAQTFGTHGIVLGSKHTYDIGFINVMSNNVIDQIGTQIWPDFNFE